MKALKSTTQSLSEARELEQAGRLTESAALYQQLVDADPINQQAVSRLLTIYRRLKEPQKELAIIENALAAYAQKDKTAREKWLTAHPQAARAGRAFLRSLGGPNVSSFGANAQVQRLLKRKEVVEKKLPGKGKAKGKGREADAKSPAAAPKTSKKHTVASKEQAVAAKTAEKQAAIAKRQAASVAKEQAASAKRQASIAKKQAAAAAKKEAAEARRQAAEERRQAAEARRQAAEERKREAQPSLFVINLRYLVSLDKIDALLPKHLAFLDKHISAGDFLVAGRQLPRTGGIIIARGKDRASIERIMKQDPFLKGKLASVDIVEFAAAKLNKKQWQKLQ